MDKEQVRKTIKPLNAPYFLDNLEKSDGKDFRTEKEKRMIDGERFSFPVQGSWNAFIDIHEIENLVNYVKIFFLFDLTQRRRVDQYPVVCQAMDFF